MDNLELKIPPAIQGIISLLVIYVSYRLLPIFDLPGSLHKVVAVACFASSGYADLSALMVFRKANTTTNPMSPAASLLVTQGIYRFTRNPMYLALLLIQLSFSVWLANPWGIVACALFIWFMNRLQIAPEEAFLEKAFVEEYKLYKSTVRRWL